MKKAMLKVSGVFVFAIALTGQVRCSMGPSMADTERVSMNRGIVPRIVDGEVVSSYLYPATSSAPTMDSGVGSGVSTSTFLKKEETVPGRLQRSIKKPAGLAAPSSPSMITSVGTVAYDYLGRPIQAGAETVLGGAYGAVAGVAGGIYNVGANLGSSVKGAYSTVKEHISPSDRLKLEAVIALPVLEIMVSSLDKLINKKISLSSTEMNDKLIALYNQNFIALNNYPGEQQTNTYVARALADLSAKGYGPNADEYKALKDEALASRDRLSENNFLYILRYNASQLMKMSSQKNQSRTITPTIGNLQNLRDINEEFRKTYAARLGQEWSSVARGAAGIGAAAVSYWLKNYFSK